MRTLLIVGDQPRIEILLELVERALEPLTKGLEVTERTLTADHILTQGLRHNLASTQLCLGNAKTAKTLLKESLDIFEASLSREGFTMQLTRSLYSYASWVCGEEAVAVRAAAKALDETRDLLSTHILTDASREIDSTVVRCRPVLDHYLSCGF